MRNRFDRQLKNLNDGLIEMGSMIEKSIEKALVALVTQNVEKAKEVIKATIAAQEKALTDPTPFIRMTDMKDSSLEITVRVWCKRSDYMTLKCDLLEAIDNAFAEAGIQIPFPQLDVHMSK